MELYCFEHSFEGFFRIAVEGKSEMMANQRSSRRVEKGPDSWSGTQTFEEAVALAINGCLELEDQVLRLAEKTLVENLAGQDNRLMAFYDVSGDEVDVGRYLEGEPECMCTWQAEDKKTGKKIISITAQIAVTHDVETDHIMNRGAAILALVYAAEQAGYRIELNVVDITFNSFYEKASVILVRVKEADVPVDISRLAMMLMHPAGARRLMFSFQETLDSEYRDIFGICDYDGYGHLPNKAEEKKIISQTHKCDIFLGSHDWGNFRTKERSANWASNKLKELDVNFIE